MRNFGGDARYLAHLWNTLIDNNYLTREFIMAHPEIVEDAHNASGRIIEAAQQSVHWTLRRMGAWRSKVIWLAPVTQTVSPLWAWKGILWQCQLWKV